MTYFEIASNIALTLLLLGLGVYFGRKQIQLGRSLAQQSDLAPAERSYLRRQVQRRLVCSVLMIVFAGFLIGWFFLQPELDAGSLVSATVDAPDQADVERSPPPMMKTITYYWIAALFVLFGLLALASIDLVATARHGFRSVRQLEHERRAELEEEIARYRRHRAEMN